MTVPVEAADATSTARPVVLVVDDEPPLARALEHSLGSEFEVLAITTPEAALEVLEERDVALVLSDQRLPGLGGVELLAEVRRRRPDVVGVLITGHADIDAAVLAVDEARAFGYLTKPWDDQEPAVVLRHAVDAHQVLRRRRGEQEEQQGQEIRSLEAMAGAAGPGRAQPTGAPLRESRPDAFDEAVQSYAELVEQAYDQRIYNVDHGVPDGLRSLAERLGALLAGPRDVVDLHAVVLRRRLADAPAERAEAYLEEGRLLVLTLMGYLVSYYRSYTIGVSS